MAYVGIDLHRRTSHVAAFDEEGQELFSPRVTNDREALRAIFAELGGEARVALEACRSQELRRAVSSELDLREIPGDLCGERIGMEFKRPPRGVA